MFGSKFFLAGLLGLLVGINAVQSWAKEAASVPPGKSAPTQPPLIVRAQFEFDSPYFLTGTPLRMLRLLQKTFPHPQTLHIHGDDHASVVRFAQPDSPFDIVATPSSILNTTEEWYLQEEFPPGKPQPLILPIAQRRLVFVVSVSNPVEELEFLKIRSVVGSDAQGKSWKEVLGKGPPGRMKCFFPPPESSAMKIFTEICLLYWKYENGAVVGKVEQLRKDVQICQSAQEILNAVRSAGPTGLGLVELPTALSANWTGLKPLGIIAVQFSGDDLIPPDPNSAKLVKPLIAPVIQPDYPLAETITLYIHPTAIERAKDFVHFCLSREAHRVISQQGYISAWQDKQERGKERLKEFLAGKGPEVKMWGLKGREALAKALAQVYVQNKALVQVRYEARHSLEEAAQEFLRSGELLLADPGPLPSSLLPAMAGGKDPKPQSQRVLLGYRAVGVIVHRDSPVTELKLEELQQIYWGRLQRWPWTDDRAATARERPLSKASSGSGAQGKIRLYGLPSDSPPMQILSRRMEPPLPAAGEPVLPTGKPADGASGVIPAQAGIQSSPLPAAGEGKGEGEMGVGKADDGKPAAKASGGEPTSPKSAPILRRPDTLGVVKAVAGDPAALGFVDLAAMPAEESSVRLIAILPPEGSPPTTLPSSAGRLSSFEKTDVQKDSLSPEAAQKPDLPPETVKPSDEKPSQEERPKEIPAGTIPPEKAAAQESKVSPSLSELPKLEEGAKASEVQRSPEAQRSRKPPRPDWLPPGYPLAEPVWLYVHQQASDLAKDFALFLIEPSEELRSALQSNGLVPAR